MLNIGAFARLGQVSPRRLRHYDEIGLLKPSQVDLQTGYRQYDLAQLSRLHRLLALLDLGFSLEQIGSVLDHDLSDEQLRGMLRLRQAQIEQDVSEEQARLRRAEAHLRALEGSIAMSSLDVAIKTAQLVRIAEASATAPGWGSDNLGPVFQRLAPVVVGHLHESGARPGIMIAWYEPPADDGSVVLHAGFDIADQEVTDSERVTVRELPSVRVASVVHHGSMKGIVPVYEALVRWIEDSGYHFDGQSRELYHHWDGTDPDARITELQMLLSA